MFRRVLILAALVLGCGVSVSAQGFRIGDAQTVTSALTSTSPITPLQATVNVCVNPANAVPCTNKASTFTSVTLVTGCSAATQVVLAGTTTCVAQTDSRGNWGAWVAAGNYDVTFTLSTGQSFGPYTISVGIPPGSTVSLGTTTTSQLNNDVVVDGIKYAQTDAGIQAAINAAEAIGSGSNVYLPTGTYSLCNNLPLLISSRVNIKGAGWSSFLQVCAGLSASTDVFLIQPGIGQTVNGIRLQDFQILPVSGHPGRHAIQFDGTNGPVVESIVEHVIVFGGLGSSSINFVNSFGAFGTPTQAVIQNCELNGGITGTQAGDTIRIVNNLIQGPGPAIDVSMFAGSSDFLVEGNNITSDGGVHVGGTSTNNVAFQFMYNEIETNPTFLGSNGSLVDVDCSSAFHCLDVIITKNTFQMVNNIVANNIRVNFADRTNIWGNRFGRGTNTGVVSNNIAIGGLTESVNTVTFVLNADIAALTPGQTITVANALPAGYNGQFILLTYSHVTKTGTYTDAAGGLGASTQAALLNGIAVDIQVTPNATDTQIGTNTWSNGGPISSILQDSGTRTVFSSGFNGAYVQNNKTCISWFDDLGTQRCGAQMDQFGAMNIFGYHGQSGATFSNGASYIFDGSAGSNIGMAVTNTPSAQPTAGDYVSLAGLAAKEVAAPAAATNFDVCYGDSTAHALKCSYNNGTFFTETQTIGTGNVTTAGTAINTLTCQAQTGITITGAQTTDNVVANIGTALPATWQTGIFMQAHVTATNTVTVYLCNPTATATITPSATQVNVRVTR